MSRADVVADEADNAVAVTAHHIGLVYLSAKGDLVFHDHVGGAYLGGL